LFGIRDIEIGIKILGIWDGNQKLGIWRPNPYGNLIGNAQFKSLLKASA
jgi:hypothetical protein